MAELINFSKTERIVLLIDLHPLLTLQNPSNYLTSVVAASNRIISFPPLSNSLFAYKFFFSSLSPLHSSSLLPASLSLSSSLSFHLPSQTLTSLSPTLNSLSISPLSSDLPLPRCSHIVKALLQLIHDYAWESEIEIHSGKADDFPSIRSNLVILLSPVHGPLKALSEFMNMEPEDDCLKNLDLFSVKFCELFGVVKDASVGRDIHCCWIDVKSKLEGNKEIVDDAKLQLELFENGIRKLGWGFCSTDVIVLGSALIPFGLIYPRISVSFDFLSCKELIKASPAQLSLQISDASGKPLECRYCNLELLNLKMVPRFKCDDGVNALKLRDSKSDCFDYGQTFLAQFGDETIGLNVKAVEKYCKGHKIESSFSDYILVRGTSSVFGKHKSKSADAFFADRVLEMLSTEMGEIFQRKSLPIWQMFLSFLRNEGSCALLSFSNSKGELLSGILKPFTDHLAVIYIKSNQYFAREFGGSKLAKINNELDNCVGMNISNSITGSQTMTSSPKNCAPLGDFRRGKNKKHCHKDLTWSSFYKAAFEYSEFDLAEVYFTRELESSKKLKFFKCWMKQIKRSGHYFLNESKQQMTNQVDVTLTWLDETLGNEIEEKLNRMHQENVQPQSPHSSSEPSGMQEGAAAFSTSQDFEAFFSSLPNKIQHGLETGISLQTLAERLVTSAIHCLYQKYEKEKNLVGQDTKTELDDCFPKDIFGKIINLLLTEPKEVHEKRKGYNSSLQAYDLNPTSGNIVREYELQILLRMEILRSKIARSIEESTKKKLVKQICSLLEIIQFLVEGGFHGQLSLNDYVEKTIKTRYFSVLQDVVDKIYAEMDLLPFDGETEAQFIFNSEDSNQSWKDKLKRSEMLEPNSIPLQIMMEDDSSRLQDSVEASPKRNGDEHDRRLSEARERRERSRRHVSFTSWIPDLQRVWAPKQPKAMRGNSDHRKKESRKKERWRASRSVVCETPMTGQKRPYPRDNSFGDEEVQDYWSNSSTAVPKALFQDD